MINYEQFTHCGTVTEQYYGPYTISGYPPEAPEPAGGSADITGVLSTPVHLRRQDQFTAFLYSRRIVTREVLSNGLHRVRSLLDCTKKHGRQLMVIPSI